jgi:hypothetical protein
MRFEQLISLSQRRELFDSIKSRFPMQLPVIVQPSQSIHSTVDQSLKIRFLLDPEKEFFSFQLWHRTMIGQTGMITPQTALYYHVVDESQQSVITPQSNATIEQLYARYKSLDGFLYIDFSLENFFG